MLNGVSIGSVIEALGGVGLFLLGMQLLTDAIRALAGEGLSRGLRRWTHSPSTGALSGALATALVQSSSATTVMAVGFAGGGVLSFAEALGIVFGANLGTTVTGWMVVWLGFKWKVSAIAPLLILVGALFRLLGHGRFKLTGSLVAAFGLVLLGLAMLQEGMAAFESIVLPQHFPGPDWLGRLALVGIGVAITLVTQSSSAGVATAIAAVHAGQLELAQAAALVIGMDVGTTFTAALATVGGSTAARRTGWAHVVYNIITGAAAFLLLPFLLTVIDRLVPGLGVRDPEIALVFFHTLFNGIGVIAILPFARGFAHVLEHLIPERRSPWTEPLDVHLLPNRELAIAAVTASLKAMLPDLLTHVQAVLERSSTERMQHLAEMENAITEVQEYLAQIPPAGRPPSESRRVDAFHLVDQMRRLVNRLEQQDRKRTVQNFSELRGYAEVLLRALRGEETEKGLEVLVHELYETREAFRHATLARIGPGAEEPEEALQALDAWRWLERVTYHSWRASYHLRKLQNAKSGATSAV